MDLYSICLWKMFQVILLHQCLIMFCGEDISAKFSGWETDSLASRFWTRHSQQWQGLCHDATIFGYGFVVLFPLCFLRCIAQIVVKIYWFTLAPSLFLISHSVYQVLNGRIWPKETLITGDKAVLTTLRMLLSYTQTKENIKITAS